MKLNILMVLFLISTPYLSSYGQMTSGYYVVSSGAMSQDIMDQLSNKIKLLLTKAGMNVTEGYFPMVTVLSYDENEVVELGGIRKSYKAIGTVNLHILFDNNSTLLSATSISIEGVGTSKSIAQANSIKKIEIPQNEMDELLDRAKGNYQKVLDDFSSKRIAQAKGLMAKGNYNDAIELMYDIPKESKHYKEAKGLIDKAVKQNENERLAKIELVKKKLEQKDIDRQENAYQMDKEREHERELETIKQENETKREEIRNRSTVEKLFSNAWNMVAGKK
jgi:hypothetical protein